MARYYRSNGLGGPVRASVRLPLTPTTAPIQIIRTGKWLHLPYRYTARANQAEVDFGVYDGIYTDEMGDCIGLGILIGAGATQYSGPYSKGILSHISGGNPGYVDWEAIFGTDNKTLASVQLDMKYMTNAYYFRAIIAAGEKDESGAKRILQSLYEWGVPTDSITVYFGPRGKFGFDKNGFFGASV